VDTDEGFSLKETSNESVIFTKSFSELVTSSDDGAR
jgi:hypothetical protein